VAGEAQKRRSRRTRTRLSGVLIGRTRQEVEVLDLSVTGCLVRCRTPFDPGMVLDLEIRIGAECLRSKARIVETSVDGESLGRHTKRHLIGLSFLATPSADEYVLRRFLRDQQSRP
jgi:hypothetical protein